MAYVIITANGQEMDRRDLTGPITIGRAPDADVPIRDILLSRKHCRIEPADEDHWRVVDLGSKNGTFIGQRAVTRHVLQDGDELRIGRTRVAFRSGAFEAAPPGTKRRDHLVRPADPTEALAGTVAGFTLVEPGEVDREAGAPVPQPRPPEPTSYASEDVYGMLNEIASSSWDSIMAQASRPLVMERPLPRPDAYRSAPRVASRPRVSFCLQAPVAETPAPTPPMQDEPMTMPTTPTPTCKAPPRKGRRCRWASTRWWNVSEKAQRSIVLGSLSAVATMLLAGAWVAAVNGGPKPAGAALPASDVPTATGMEQSDVMDLTFPSVVPEEEPAVQTAATVPGIDFSLPRHVTMGNVMRATAVQIFSRP